MTRSSEPRRLARVSARKDSRHASEPWLELRFARVSAIQKVDEIVIKWLSTSVPFSVIMVSIIATL